MPLKPTERRALNLASRKGGARRDDTPDRTVDLLTAANLITEHDPHNDGTWIILITKTGRAALTAPARHVPLYLARPTANQGDYTEERHRAIDDLEVVPPSAGAVKRAQDLGDKQRASFRRDLEIGRAQQKRDIGGMSNRALRHVNSAQDRRDAA